MTDFKDLQIKRYDSVGGWLLLLCLALTIFSPIRTVYNLVTTYEEINQLFTTYPGLQTVYYIDMVVSIVLMLFSIRAGYMLWNIKPGAVKIAKNYLLLFLAYSVFAAFLPFTAGLPSEANDLMIPEVIKGILQGVFFFVVWYWYLSVSKRVKATYVTDIIYTENEVVEEAGSSTEIADYQDKEEEAENK